MFVGTILTVQVLIACMQVLGVVEMGSVSTRTRKRIHKGICMGTLIQGALTYVVVFVL